MEDSETKGEEASGRSTTAADPTFHRPPRAWPDRPRTDELRIHAPPAKPEPPSGGGLMQAMFPALGSVGLIGFALVYGNPLFIYLGVGLVTLSILFVIGLRWSQHRGVEKRRRRNRSRYRAYLSSVETELSGGAAAQLTEGDRLYPDHERLWGLVLARRHLWERRVWDPDFLRLRLGRGPVDHSRPIRLELGDDPIAERERDLEDEAATVRKRWRQVTDMPVTIDLRDTGVVSVVGPPEVGRALARSVISQLAAFRAPDDLRVLASFPPAAAAEWEWMKWLPHARGQPRPGRSASDPANRSLLLADSVDGLAQLLDGELGPRLEQLQRIDEQAITAQSMTLDAPRLLIFVDGFTPDGDVARLASIRDAMARGRRLDTTLVLLTDAPEHEPSEADVRVVLTRGAATVEERGDQSRRWEGVWPDAADGGLCEAIARSLAPLRLEDREAGRVIADDVRLLELMGHRSASDVDPQRTWRERADRERLRVPIGVSAGGEPLALDLKEAAQGGLGPHGLIVGATGSGKSELLRTLVAGLAVRHSPEELSFVLIDYKGGSAFAELSRLPHTAGLITNLQRDRALVERMRDALLGEQERRQAMLRDAGDLDDIGAYRTARASDPELAPMPHLLVIVDEFGELLAARPEFIDLFLGIGRVGRSLGMHLLFSTQRLDEGRLRGLESHLRYRICLRTYSATESKVVLGTPDAYLLPSLPGAAYLKVDTGIYERFKVALVSGATAPQIEDPEADRRVEVFASSLADVVPEEPASSDGGPSDLEAVVALLARAGAREHVHQVWVPPLEREVGLEAVSAGVAPWWERTEPQTGLRAPVGLVDKPVEQRTEPLVLDFEGRNGHLAVVGAPQSGKSTFLRTMATALVRSHRPDEARLYLLDLGGGGLRDLEAAPHTGTVCTKAEPEGVRQTVRFVRGVLAKRQASFSQAGIASMHEARVARSDGAMEAEDLADVFLFVDGWSVLRQDFEGLDIELEQLAGEGLNYGVHLAISANRWAEMRPHLRDNVGSRLELRLNDPIDSELSRKLAASVPEDAPGRGLTAAGLHFQTAMPDAAVVVEAASRWTGSRVASVPVLPSRLEQAELPRPEEPVAGVAIGVEELELRPVYVDLTGGDPHFVVLGDSETGKSNLLRLIAQGLTTSQDPGRAQLTILDYRRGMLDLASSAHVRAYAASAPAATDAVMGLRDELATRLPDADTSAEELLKGPSWAGPRHYVLVDDYDLVPDAMANPLAPLVDLLAQGRDIGLHVVLARRVGGLATASFEGFLKRLFELRVPGLLMSGSPSEGTVLGGRRATPLPPGRGQLISRDSDAGLVQTAVAGPAEAPGATPDVPLAGYNAAS